MPDDPLAPKVTRDTLPGILAGMRQRKLNGRRHNPHKPAANRFCRICTKTWHKQQILIDPQLKPDICDACQKELDRGQIAVRTTSGRHAFIYSFSLAGQGPIIEISEEVMDRVEAEAKNQQPPTEEKT